MRSVGWLRVTGLGVALIVVGCGSTPDDNGGIRAGNSPGGRAITGSGGSSSQLGGNPSSFGNGTPNVTGLGSGGAAQMNDDSCGRTDITATRVTPTVMLVLDGSTSMEMMY